MLSKKALRFAVAFAVMSAAMTIAAFVAVIAESGRPQASAFCAAVVYIASWPSLLLGTDPRFLLMHTIRLFVVNAFGWACVGYIIGAVLWRRSHAATPTV